MYKKVLFWVINISAFVIITYLCSWRQRLFGFFDLYTLYEYSVRKLINVWAMIATSSSISEILFYLLIVDKEHIEVTIKLLFRRNNSLGIVLYKNSSAIKFVLFFKGN